MQKSFYFYDLETTGFNPFTDRIVQFAGQRTDMDLKEMGESHNIFIKLNEDILPDPDAVLVTGITPQQTIEEGITEVEFMKLFNREIAVPGTVFIGFNNLRFDDNFLRAIHYRNFFDPYKWHWQNNRSRWDLLDLVRITRALRPKGISWPTDESGVPVNKLELLTKVNKIEHLHAHDALSDVVGTIKVAQLVKSKQNKLFDYLFKLSDKSEIKKLVDQGQPFVYSSGKYPSEYQKTTVAVKVADNPNRDGALVYDLRVDPLLFKDMTVHELTEAWRWKDKDDKSLRLPVKTMQYNRCPAIAPIGVLDKPSQKNIQIDLKLVESNFKKLKSLDNFSNKLLDALSTLDKEQSNRQASVVKHVDEQLYDGFFGDQDQQKMERLVTINSGELDEFNGLFKDKRLNKLLPLYKARNFPKNLTDLESQDWEEYKKQKLIDGGENSKLAKYFRRIEELRNDPKTTTKQKIILDDLDLYGQSLIPDSDF